MDAVRCLHNKPLESLSARTDWPHLPGSTWRGAAVCGDNFKRPGRHYSAGATYTGMYLLLLLWLSRKSLGVVAFQVLQPSNGSCVPTVGPRSVAAVTITSGMRKDSCEGKAGDLSRALSHSAVQGASCSPCYCTRLKRRKKGGETLTWKLSQAVFMHPLCLKVLKFYFGLVSIKVMLVESFSCSLSTVMIKADFFNGVLTEKCGWVMIVLSLKQNSRGCFLSLVSRKLPSVQTWIIDHT